MYLQWEAPVTDGSLCSTGRDTVVGMVGWCRATLGRYLPSLSLIVLNIG